jgi:Leucine-rich repeat (LRR) protein
VLGKQEVSEVVVEQDATVASLIEVRLLVAQLDPGQGWTHGERAEAAWAINKLRYSNQDTIVQAGAIDLLVALLSSGGDIAKGDAAAILEQLAGNPIFATAIVQAGGIEPLVSLLSTGGEKARHSAASIFSAIVARDTTADQQALARGIVPLIALLSTGTATAAVVALNALVDRNADNLTAIVQAGGIKPLVLLRHHSEASDILRKLSASDSAYRALVFASGGISHLRSNKLRAVLTKLQADPALLREALLSAWTLCLDPGLHHDVGPAPLDGLSPHGDLMDILQEAARDGHAGAQVRLGCCFFVGNHVSKDFEEAARFFHMAAIQGNIDAEKCLHVLYKYGLGVAKDEMTAQRFARFVDDDHWVNSRGALEAEMRKEVASFTVYDDDLQDLLLDLLVGNMVGNTMVKSLDVSLSYDDGGMDGLFQALRGNHTLTRLEVGSSSILCANQAVAGFLAENDTLEELVLYNLDDSVACALGEALRLNTTLTSLDLVEGFFRDEGVRALGEALRLNSTLTSLNLGCNEIGDEGARALGEALRLNSTLTSLNLGCNEIGDEGARALVEALGSNSTLTSLTLCHNMIGDDGVRALGKALRSNTTLTSLTLCEAIGDEGARAWRDALRSNSTLTSLDLSHNEIGDEGARALGEALGSNSTLTSLDLSHNKIGDEGVRAVAESLRRNTSLTKLSVSENEMRNSAASHFVAVLREGNSSLTRLVLNRRHLNRRHRTELVAALKENRAAPAEALQRARCLLFCWEQLAKRASLESIATLGALPLEVLRLVFMYSSLVVAQRFSNRSQAQSAQNNHVQNGKPAPAGRQAPSLQLLQQVQQQQALGQRFAQQQQRHRAQRAIPMFKRFYEEATRLFAGDANNRWTRCMRPARRSSKRFLKSGKRPLALES